MDCGKLVEILTTSLPELSKPSEGEKKVGKPKKIETDKTSRLLAFERKALQPTQRNARNQQKHPGGPGGPY